MNKKMSWVKIYGAILQWIRTSSTLKKKKKKKTFYGTKIFTLELKIVGLATYKCGGKITHVTR